MCSEPALRRCVPRPRPRSAAAGFALLEALIALLLLSVGALGLLRLSVSSLAVARDSDHYVVASIRATELMDTIRVVPGLDDSFWTIGKTQSASDLPSGEKRSWLSSVEATLPKGKAAVSCSAGLCGITLYWTPLAQDSEMSARFTIGKP